LLAWIGNTSILTLLFPVIFPSTFLDSKRGSDSLSWTILLCSTGFFFIWLFHCQQSYITFYGTKESVLPSWEWHNSAFSQIIWLVLCNSFVFWPLFVTWILHSLDQEFWTLLSYSSLLTRNLLLGEMIIFCVLFMTTIFFMFYITKNLNSDNGFENTYRSRVISLICLLSNIAFALILLILAVRTKNAGVIIAFVMNMLCEVFIIRNCVRVLRSPHQIEEWYSRMLLTLIIHVFILLCVFWLSILLSILSDHFSTEFVMLLSSSMEKSRFTLSIALIILMFVYVMTSFCLLRVHANVMSVIESQEDRLAANPPPSDQLDQLPSL